MSGMRAVHKEVHGRSWTSTLVRGTCIFLTVAFVGLFLLLPLVSIFYEALKPVKVKQSTMMMDDSPPAEDGGEAKPAAPPSALAKYWEAITDPDSLHAMKMTLIVAALAVPLNTVFGVAAAWAIAKFNF